MSIVGSTIVKMIFSPSLSNLFYSEHNFRGMAVEIIFNKQANKIADGGNQDEAVAKLARTIANCIPKKAAPHYGPNLAKYLIVKNSLTWTKIGRALADIFPGPALTWVGLAVAGIAGLYAAVCDSNPQA